MAPPDAQHGPVKNARESSSAHRVRGLAFLGLLLVVCIGLASRSQPLASIPILGTYFGDAMWAMAAYAVVRILLPHWSIWKIALIALLFSFAVECSQLWNPEWLENLRGYRPIALLIGRGFIWIDLVAYTIGVAVAAVIERLAWKRFGSRN